MRFMTVKNCGEVGIDFFNIDTDGASVSRDFLTKLTLNIVRRSTAFYDEIRNPGDHIFSYRERQLHSILAPSIADITASFIMEHPLSRKPHGEQEFRGHVDYWVSYRNYSFLIEFKHAFFAYNRVKSPNSNLTEKFDEALWQLKSVRIDQCRDLTPNKGLIKMALEAIVFYEGSKYPLSRNSLEGQDFKKIFNMLMKNMKFTQRLDFQALWILHKRLVEPWQFPKEYEIYPALAFFGNISEMVY